MINAFAPAKVNLTLHGTGQRDDGYHLLDSLVAFADIGDWISVEKSDSLSLSVTGPMAKGVPTDASNLVIRAAQMMGVTAKITLEKHLPAAAGIGGGSSDAAATIRALMSLYDLPIPNAADLLSLGADVPVCLSPNLSIMRGIGEDVTALDATPNWSMLLINPRVSVPTGPVFRALPSKTNAPMSGELPDWSNLPAAADWLAQQRNDLQAPAIALQPVIGDVLAAFEATKGLEFARMSGSGATCFGLYADRATRDAALAGLQTAHPNWWIAPAQTYAAYTPHLLS